MFHDTRSFALLLSRDEHPDRDSLCYACDVNREIILVDISHL